ncbi:MAG: hypothetical protein J2P22_13860 [Nocardioides sp.]|nr:hypothetical protein [Nocardioides sp.]
MKDARQLSLDETTDAAWSRFRQALADRLAGLDVGDAVVVRVEGDDSDDACTPYVQASSDDGQNAVAEVSSNHFLHRRHHLDKAARRQLRELGWVRPSSRRDTLNYSWEFDLTRADEVAVMMVRALREVFGVVHPAFLVAPFLGPGVETSERNADTSPPEPLAVEPEDKTDLDRLVDAALTPFFGHVPSRDDDGDIPVSSGSAIVFVRVLETRPMIHLFAELAVEVTEPERATYEVGVLNRDWPYAKFALAGQTVRAHVYLPAYPFVPEHLRQALTMMCEMADAVDDDLAFRVSGRTFLSPSGRGNTDGGCGGECSHGGPA